MRRPKLVGLIWDDENIAHMERHRVTQWNADDVVTLGQWVWTRNKNRRSKRRRLIGPDFRNRVFTIILEPATPSGYWRPITAWPSSLKEIQLWEQLRR